jgi:secondary thiamine-phosphate synthase enzyme
MIEELSIKTSRREELVDVTGRVQEVVNKSGEKSGLVVCFVKHTTAGITINENADPDVRRDILYKLGKEIPKDENYQHAEGNSDAHIKASLMGFSLSVLFQDGRLILGTWQGLYFCEFDGPRARSLLVKVIPIA